MVRVASCVPTTAGMPYSRATVAACDRRPPRSVTTAPSSGITPVVRLGRHARDEHVTSFDAWKALRAQDEARAPFVATSAGIQATHYLGLDARVWLVEQRVHAASTARFMRRAAGGYHSGGGGGAGAKPSVFGATSQVVLVR